MKLFNVNNEHDREVSRALPKLMLDISLLFLLVQGGLAALNWAGHFVLAHLKH